MRTLRKLLSIFLLISLLAGAFAGCSAKKDNNFQSSDDFQKAKIGVLTGSAFEQLVIDYFPDAKKLYYINMPDLILNLKQKKIDGILMDKGFFTPLAWEDSKLSYVELDMPPTEYAVAFPKTEKSKALIEQMNAFIRSQDENGGLKELEEKWLSSKEPDGSLDLSQLTGENGTLRVATTVESQPFDYLQNGQFAGFDADFIYRFAQEYGYALEIDIMDFGGLMASLKAERYDLAISSITITEARKENILFSDIYCSSPIVMAVLGDGTSTGSLKTLADLENVTLGIVTGTSWDLIAQKQFPNAERKYFSSDADVLLALSQGKIDAFLADKTVFTAIQWESDEFTCIDEPIGDISNALILAKEGYDENLLAQINTFVAKCYEDGTLDRLATKWFADKEPEEHPDYTKLTGENGTLRIAVCDTQRPISYQRGSMYTGYEVDFLTLFAEEYGYRLELAGMAFSALIPSVATGKSDIGACGITITPERQESVTFADPHFKTHGVAVIRNETGSQTNSAQNPESLQALENGKFAILTGSIWDGVLKELLPNAEMKYFTSMTDMVLALSQGKVDAILGDETFYLNARWENTPVEMLDETVGSISCAMILAKDTYDPVLLEQLNTFIAKARTDGTVDALRAKWLTETEPAEHPDYKSLPGENGTLKIALENAARPMTYQKNDGFTGFDVELLTMFAKEYGYGLEFAGMSFDALIPTISTGKCDIGVCGIAITEERAQSVTYTDCYTEINGVVIVAESDNGKQGNMTLADFETGTIGIITGSAHDGLVKKNFPKAKRVYFNTMADMMLAVEQGKVDCYIEDAPFLAPLLWEGLSLKRLNKPVAQVSNGFVFPEGDQSDELRQQINDFLAEARSDGTIDRLVEKWLGDTEPTEHPDYSQLTGENGTIHLAISVDNKPMLYQNAEGYTGFEMELLTLFGQHSGYAFDIEVVPFESIIAGISSGKYEMGASTLNITPEREESVDFSDPYAYFDVVLVTKKAAEQSTGKTLADFENAKIGIHTGSIYDTYAKERFPNAELAYYNLLSDMMVALDQGKIDGFISETTYITGAIWEGAKIKSVEEPIAYTNAAYVLQKGESSAQLREQLNAFIRDSKENGTIDKLRAKWLGATEPTEMPDYQSLTGENGTIRVAVAPDVKPITYMKDGEPTGYEIELLTMFAKEYGYKLDISYMSFDAVLPGVTTGKYDIGTGAITITEERAESLDFSESHLTDDVIMIIKAEDDIPAAQNVFWSGVKESFEKTFIRENRWKLIVEGVGVTMFISICSAFFGTLLGFGLYMLSRSDVKLLQLLAKGIAKVYSRIVAGTPIVVILMILFYVVFGKVQDMSGVVVAIIGFTMTFGAFVYDHMTVSASSVDRGQTEAAYALGYTKNKAFFRIVFPQAMTIFLPSYCGQAVELIKATAVVGYIAVNDLTKMGDIIRSNTYEAFFPLIATAVIYFLLTWMLSGLLGLLKRHFEPKRRSREDILRGVKTV